MPRAKRTVASNKSSQKRHFSVTKKNKKQIKAKLSNVLYTAAKRSMSKKSQDSSAYFEEKNELDRVKGEFSTFYRNAVLTKVLSDMTSHGGPVTYFNICGGNVAHQLKESHLHKDAIFLYKWLRLPLGLRRIPSGTAPLKPWLHQFAYAN